ncbi:MAG: DNA-directed RNA polymerase [Oligoflexales bacterium]
MKTQSKQDQQLQLETEMLGMTVTRYRNQLSKAVENRLETSTKAGLRLLKGSINPMIEAIEDYYQVAYSSKGQKPAAYRYMSLLEPEVLAFLTAKSILNSVTLKQPLTHAACQLGELIEDEVRFRFYSAEKEEYYRAVYNRVKVKSSYEYKRTVLLHSMSKAGVVWEPWETHNKLQLGKTLIDLFINATKLVEIIVVRERKNTRYYVTATPKTLEWLDIENTRCEILAPTHFPMVVEPKDWTTPFDGGYIGVMANRSKLVKTYNSAYLDELSHIEMPLVYQAINRVQKTAWKINQPVLQVLETIWENDLEMGDLPPRDDCKPRVCPFPPELKPKAMTLEQQAIFKDWKREAANLHNTNVINRSKRLLVSKIIYLANKFQKEARIYFPYCLDFRGRVYAIPHFLNPQGPDVAKALLTFSEGKPIGNETAAKWLAIHGANVYGYDKVSLKERVQFIHEMNLTILAIADNPFEATEWTQASKPWQFLAFCFEWAGYLKEGFGFVSHLPVALDGSCNGLQHFSAMLRDEVGGRAVNLIPSEQPQDIYQQVADVTSDKLDKILRHSLAKRDLAEGWLSLGVTRTITKRPVMILPYGGTRHACRQYIEDELRYLLRDRKNPFQQGERDRIFEASDFLAGLVWESIGEVVVAARDVMDWLRKAASLIGKEGLPINWTSPSGFPVQQAYRDVRTRRIKTKLSGNMIRGVHLTIQETLDSIDKRRQANGISPNFVHSMDAAALHLYINLAGEYSIDSFSLIHDSYGTLAADTEVSACCIREVFVRMYQDDVLYKFRAELLSLLSDANARRLPPLPAKGTLDLEAVKQSAFFFA